MSSTTDGAATANGVGGATTTGDSVSGGGTSTTIGDSSVTATGTTGASGGNAGAGGTNTTATTGEASGGTTGAGGTNMQSECADATTLREAAVCTGRPIGVALRDDLLNNPSYTARAREFGYVTCENEMKWDATEPSPGQFTFNRGDAIVNFANQNDMLVKGHTLVWHSQLPAWVTSITNADQLRQAMLDHIEGVAGYYRGKVYAWDVVNEAFDDNGELRNSVWMQYLGESFIDDAFIAARAADPDAKLYYNDYDIESATAKADAAYELAAGLVERGVPIDGVGMQMHTRSTDEDPSVPEFEANLQRIVDLGLELLISEMDVRLCEGTTTEDQKRRFHDIIQVCLAYPGCTAITIWGISDQHSWLNSDTGLACVGGASPRPLLWDDNFNEKPAYDGVMEALLGR